MKMNNLNVNSAQKEHEHANKACVDVDPHSRGQSAWSVTQIWAGLTHTVHQHLAELFGSYDGLGQFQRVGGPEDIHRGHRHLGGFTWSWAQTRG